jgi:hypothetical protein
MKWGEAKKLIKAGDLIACSHQPWKTLSDIESHIVRIVTQSEYSHVAVAWFPPDGEPHLIEAVVPCVTLSPLEKYLDYGFFLLQTPDKPMTQEEESYGMSKLGEPYSKWEAVEGELELLNIGASGKWQCSELTIAMRKLSNLDLGPTATPACVVQRALQLGYTMKYITKD